jgi:3-methyl-2-oxobutanoate hydroxymethyltransferase
MSRVTTATIKEKKRNKQKISMLTSYDYSMAAMVDEAGR